MRRFKPNFFGSTITDAPYGLGFMGKGWDHGVPGVEFWAEALRVTKPGGILMAFGGTRTWHRMAVAIEDSGWEIRDCIMWLYGQGFPKSLDISKAMDKAAGAEREVVAEGKPVKRMIPGADQHRTGSWIKDNGREFVPSSTSPATDLVRHWDGWGTALKPLDGTFAGNAETWGVAGLNIDGGRVGFASDTDAKQAHNNALGPVQRFKTTKAIYEGGKQNGGFADTHSPLGRWPANIILDEEAAAMLDDQTGMLGSGSGVVRKAGPGAQPFRTDRGWNQHSMKREGASAPEDYGDSGGASRFFYCAKASRSERGEGNTHPTVKPISLMKYLCGLVKMPTPQWILDPFCGSGSTGIACRMLGIPFVGIDSTEGYLNIAKNRLEQATAAR